MVSEQSKLLLNGPSSTLFSHSTLSSKKEKLKAILVAPNEDDFFRIPPFYQFNPSDIELILLFLKPQLMNKPFPFPHNRIRIREASSLYSLDEIAGTKREAYFFCSRYRKYRDGEWSNRAASKGYWKAIGANRPINYKGVTVGFRPVLVFYEGETPEGNITTWIMHEYRVFKPEEGPSNTEKSTNIGMEFEYILCKIYKGDNRSFRRGQWEKALDREIEDDYEDSIVSKVQNFEDGFYGISNLFRGGS